MVAPRNAPRTKAHSRAYNVARARRFLKGGFIPNDLDLSAIAHLLRYDSRAVIVLRERHNQRYYRRKDIGTAWSVALEDGSEPLTTSKSLTFDAVGSASDIARGAQLYDYRPPDFSVEPRDVHEAKFRWIYLGCADKMTITSLGHDLRWLDKPIASDLEAAIEDVQRQYAELEAKLQRTQMERARAAFLEDPST